MKTFVVLAYAMFLTGYAIHLFLWIDEAVRDPTNGAKTRLGLLKLNAARLLARFFLSLILFGLVRAHPSFLVTLLGYVGVTPSGVFSELLAAPLDGWLCGLYGYGADSLLGYIPILKSYIPPLPAAAPPAAKT